MKIKAISTFKGQDLYSTNHRKPIANYKKGEVYEVHEDFAKVCIDGKLAEPHKDTKMQNKKPENKMVKNGKENKGKKADK